MRTNHCILLGAPIQDGTGRLGCDMGPSAFRAAGLATTLRELGYTVEDRGNVSPAAPRRVSHPNPALKSLPEVVGWTEALAEATYAARRDGMPVVCGGDHSLAAGTLTAWPATPRRSVARFSCSGSMRIPICTRSTPPPAAICMG